MIRYDKDDNDLVLCQTYSDSAEAHIVLGMLEAHGIRAIIDNDIFSSLYPIGFNSIGGLRLMVRKRDLERALCLINENNDQ